MQYATQVVKWNLKKWKSSNRIIILLLFMAFIQVFFTIAYLMQAHASNYPINLFEPYLTTSSHRFATLMLGSVYGLIVCDIPVRYNGYIYALIKKNRKSWLLSQWLYLLTTSLIVCLSMLIIAVVLAIPFSFIANEWSIPTLISSRGSKIMASPIFFIASIPITIVNNLNPFSATLYAFLLQLLVCIFIGAVCILANIYTNKQASPLIVIIIIALDWFHFSFFPDTIPFTVLSWINPMYHGFLYSHQYGYNYNTTPSLNHSIIILITTIAILYFISNRRMKRTDLLTLYGGNIDG